MEARLVSGIFVNFSSNILLYFKHICLVNLIIAVFPRLATEIFFLEDFYPEKAFKLNLPRNASF